MDDTTATIREIPVGRDHELERISPVRTEAQLQTISRLVTTDEFDFACNNPFTREVGGYKGDHSTSPGTTPRAGCTWTGSGPTARSPSRCGSTD